MIMRTVQGHCLWYLCRHSVGKLCKEIFWQSIFSRQFLLSPPKRSWLSMRSITGSQTNLLSSVRTQQAGRLVSISWEISCVKSWLHKHIKVWKWEFHHEFMNINQVVSCVQCSIKLGVTIPVTSKVKISRSQIFVGNVSSWWRHALSIMCYGRVHARCEGKMIIPTPADLGGDCWYTFSI